MTDKERLNRLHALCLLQLAENHALLVLLMRLNRALGPDDGAIPGLGDEFLRLRKEALQVQLESQEDTNKGLAAELQRLLDEASGESFPY